MTAPAIFDTPLVLKPRLVPRVWGSRRFTTDSGPVGEAWVVCEDNQAVNGPFPYHSLREIVNRYPVEVLGTRLTQTGETRFPLLVKLIEAKEWLSIQVHPDDVLAQELEGRGARGKTEAWFALEAEHEAAIMAGVAAGTSSLDVHRAIDDGTIEEIVARYEFRAGDAIMIPAGTIHALGPGILIYEIQQSSDITYRVFDWNRPATAGRVLHPGQSKRAIKVESRPEPSRFEHPLPGDVRQIARTPYFALALGTVSGSSLRMQPQGDQFHVITAIDGEISLDCGGDAMTLDDYGSALVPACLQEYWIRSVAGAKVLIASPFAM